MKTRERRRVWAIGAALACCVAVARAQESAPADPFPSAKPEEVGLEPAALDGLARFVEQLVESDGLVGVELLVIKNDRTVLHRAFGWKDREQRVPMELDTLFCVRSMTKPVVGTAAQFAIEGKRLKPGDAVAKHLASFDTDTHRAITVEQLLRHTSGLGLSSFVSSDVSAVKSLRDVADLAAASKPLFPAGERWSYSDDGTDVLGALLERAEAVSLERLLRERLFQPLGMRDTLTFVAMDEPLRARIASNYGGSRGNWKRYWKPDDPSLFPVFLASQGLYTTPRDYARFLALWKGRGFAAGKRLLRGSTVDRALAPAVPASFPTGFRAAEIHWGEMWMLWVDTSRAPERELLAFGHGGSDGTFAYVFPKLDLMVLEFSQSRNNNSFVEFESALEEHLLRPLRTTELAEPIEYGAAELDALAGLYWLADDDKLIALERAEHALLVEFPGKARLAVTPTPTRDRFDFALVPDTWITIERDDGRPSAVIKHHASSTERYARFQPAADLPTLDQVLELRARSIDFERVRALGPLRLEGRFEMSPRGVSGTTTVLCDGPERSRSEFTGGGFDATILLDGDESWTVAGGREPTVEDAAAVERALFDHVLFSVSDWRSRFVELRVLTRYEGGGSPQLLLRGTTRHGNARYLGLDAATGRLRWERRIEPDMGAGEIGAVVTYDDWRAVGGVEVPMHVRYAFANKLVGAFDVRFESAELAGELSPDAFRPQAR